MLVMEEDVVVVDVVLDVAYHYVFHYFAGDTGERDESVVGGRVLLAFLEYRDDINFAFFQSSGTDSVFIECVIMVVRTGARSTAVSRMTLAAMASGPVALSTLIFSSSFSTPASVIKGYSMPW